MMEEARTLPAPDMSCTTDSKIRRIFQMTGDSLLQNAGAALSEEQKKLIRNIRICRTKECGFNIEVCGDCGFVREHYNSCSDRNCPICSAMKRELWVDERSAEVIDAPYYHAVFTCAPQLRPLFLANQRDLYGLFHRCVGEAIVELSQDPKYLGATPGVIQVLHTWNQELDYHPHIHAVISGGGLTPDRRLIVLDEGSFFIPESVLSAKFRGKFLSELDRLWKKNGLRLPGGLGCLHSPSEWGAFKNGLYNGRWVAFVKETFNGRGNAIEYLGRYANRVAISESRILSVTEEKVTFTARGGDGMQSRTLERTPEEFSRLFLMHVLPKGFQKIRYYGYLNNAHRRENLVLIFNLQGYRQYLQKYKGMTKAEVITARWGKNPTACPRCHSCSMSIVYRSRLHPSGGG